MSKKKPHEQIVLKVKMSGKWLACHNMTWDAAMQSAFITAIELESGAVFEKNRGAFIRPGKGETSES